MNPVNTEVENCIEKKKTVTVNIEHLTDSKQVTEIHEEI